MTKQVSLWVNDECIDIDYFVSGLDISDRLLPKLRPSTTNL